ncbi:MAG: alpha-amylase [Tissierellia bacterium]|nr:alpha-amylase [Tissierellia bacterium]
MLENAVMLQAFHWYLPADSKHWTRLINQVPHFKEVGINSLWLPPFSKGQSVFDVGYGIYDLFDLGEFNQKGTIPTKYGTKAQLVDLINTLHSNGMLVYADLVMNHKAGADYIETFAAVEVNRHNRTEEVGPPHDIQGWTGFNFPGRNGKYDNFIWNHNHFVGVDYDVKANKPGIYRVLGEGKGWAQGVTNEQGNDDYLMFADIDHRHPEVIGNFFKWSDWLVDDLKVDGFRLDALKHIDSLFINQFAQHIKLKNDKNLYIFGEYWLGDERRRESYLNAVEYDVDLFDVALHFNFQDASLSGTDYDMRKIFHDTLVCEHPLLAVTFVDNHDTQPGQALESYIGNNFKKQSYTLILLRKDGYPCVFYGDYYGVTGEYPMDSYKDFIDKLLFLRKRYATGNQEDIFDDSNCIAWIRHGKEPQASKLIVLVSNGTIAEKTICLGTKEAGSTYYNYLDDSQTTTLDNEGVGVFSVGKSFCSAYIKKSMNA